MLCFPRLGGASFSISFPFPFIFFWKRKWEGGKDMKNPSSAGLNINQGKFILWRSRHQHFHRWERLLVTLAGQKDGIFKVDVRPPDGDTNYWWLEERIRLARISASWIQPDLSFFFPPVIICTPKANQHHGPALFFFYPFSFLSFKRKRMVNRKQG